MLVFESGVIGTLAAGWVDVSNPVSLEICGTQGHATVVNNQLFFQSELVPGADGKSPWTDLPPSLPHAFELFLDAVAGQTGVPLVTVEEAAERSRVMEAIYLAAAQEIWMPL
jgi:predicted dehydrogenase